MCLDSILLIFRFCSDDLCIWQCTFPSWQFHFPLLIRFGTTFNWRSFLACAGRRPFLLGQERKMSHSYTDEEIDAILEGLSPSQLAQFRERANVQLTQSTSAPSSKSARSETSASSRRSRRFRASVESTPSPHPSSPKLGSCCGLGFVWIQASLA